MIVYKIDQQPHTKANTEIKDMGAVLSEIAPTLRTLQELLKQHEASISIPSLNSFRQELQSLIPEAIRLTHMISINSQRLSMVSDQATRQLGTLDGSVRSALVSKSGQTQPTPEAQGTTNEAQTLRQFLRQSN